MFLGILGFVVVDSQMPLAIFAEAVSVDKTRFLLEQMAGARSIRLSRLLRLFLCRRALWRARMHSCSVSLPYLPAFRGRCSRHNLVRDKCSLTSR